MSMAQITSSREDITDRHVQSAFAGVVSGFSVLAGAFYASLYLPMMWRLVAISVAIPLLMWKARAWVKAQNKPPRRVLMMLSNHETGYDADEARVAADAFEEWGMEPVWCSLQGGAAPSVKGMTGVEGDDETVPLARCPAADFVALYLVGGPGPAFEWVKSAPLHARVAEILQQGGTVGACGTGVAGLSEVVQRVSGDHVLYITGAKVATYVEKQGPHQPRPQWRHAGFISARGCPKLRPAPPRLGQPRVPHWLATLGVFSAQVTKELKAMDTSARHVVVGKLAESAKLVVHAMAAAAPAEAPSARALPPPSDKSSKKAK